MRTLSTPLRQALYAQETDQVILLLLTISHATLSPPIRVVSNLTSIVSRGNTFTAWPFQITLPGDYEDQLPSVSLTIDNVDRQIVQAVRNLTTAPTITLEVVLAAVPNTVEAAFDFTLRRVEYDAMVVSGVLAFEDVLNESFPQYSFTPNTFPGMF